MQFSDLQARAALLASFEGWSDVSPSPDWSVLVNRAWGQFSWDAETQVTSTTFSTVAGQAQYTISGGPWKNLLDVTWNSLPLIRSTEEYERSANPLWLVQTSGTPVRWTFNGFNVITLIPRPDSIHTLSVRGITQGANMVDSTDNPGQVSGVGTALPEAFCEGIAVRAAWLQGIVYAQGAAMDRLQLYESRYREYVGAARADLFAGFRKKGPDER